VLTPCHTQYRNSVPRRDIGLERSRSFKDELQDFMVITWLEWEAGLIPTESMAESRLSYSLVDLPDPASSISPLGPGSKWSLTPSALCKRDVYWYQSPEIVFGRGRHCYLL
jgi:hypothetical protein